jgi:hypothetical protein
MKWKMKRKKTMTAMTTPPMTSLAKMLTSWWRATLVVQARGS